MNNTLDIHLKIGQKIKKIRLKRGMTQQDVSEITGIRLEYIDKIEHGKACRITLKHLEKITNSLNINLLKFLETV